jgi:uncharacterized protein (TIGR03000 family)
MAPALTPPATPTPAPPPPREPNTPTPAIPPAPAAEPPVKPTTSILAPDAALMTVLVPADAKVFVNGYETKSKGERRQYVSHGLQAGLSYNYQIRVVATRDGKPVEENRTVTLTAGQQSSVALLDAKQDARLALKW